MKQHKHSECIKAWADGYQIEEQWESRGWVATDEPYWFPHLRYRIRPEAKPDINKLKGCTFKASTGRWTLSKQTSKG
tara:strand:+ start:16 stop:246 length:231 start_codon:yes stop_codon:yes gene_type:complete